MTNHSTSRSGTDTAVIVIAADDLSAEVFIDGSRHVVHGADAKATCGPRSTTSPTMPPASGAR